MKPRPFDFARKPARTTATHGPCVCCGKSVPLDAPLMVHVVAGGAAYGDEREDPNDASDMGWHPVGAACARKLRKLGVFVAE